MNAKVVIAVLLLVGGVIVAFAGAQPQAALSPTEALDPEEGSHGHDQVAVKGAVAHVDAENRTFVLTDGQANLTVHLDQALPTQIRDGISLVAEGQLERQGDRTVLLATEVLVGCPSQYEA